MEHKLGTDELAALCRSELEAFDQLPPYIREFVRNSEIPMSAVAILKHVRMFGAQSFIPAARQFIKQWQAAHPICKGAA